MSATEFATSRRRFLTIAGLSVGAVAGVSACGTTAAKTTPAGSGAASGAAGPLPGIGNNGQVGKGRSGATADTLLIAGFQWGPPANYSPFAATPAWPASANVAQYIYESALRFNIVTGELLPGLAKSYKTEGGKITLTWQDGVTFSDGSPCTAKDLAYTYEMGKTDKSVALSAIWSECTDISAPDDKTCVFTLDPARNNFGVVLNMIATQWVLPKKIWEPVLASTGGKLTTHQTMEPIGTGPFKVNKSDQTQVVLDRNDNYWGKTFYGGLPVFKQVIHPIFKSNEDGNIKFQAGELDIMQQFVPQIWKMWEGGKPVGTYLKEKPYYVPGSMPMFLINCTKPGLDNAVVRKAMAWAVDYASIAETAMSGYSAPVQASLIMPTGAESKWFNADAAGKGWKYDPAAAEKLLKDAGGVKGADGIYSINGVRLGPWKLITPTGWTDWNASLDIVAKNLKAIGIDAATNFPQQAEVATAYQSGNFDMGLWYVAGVSPASPWQRFSDVMSNVDFKDVGQTAFRNYSRFKNDKVNDLLVKAASSTADADKKAAYEALDNLYRENVPAFPLMYRPDEFYEYNATNFYNWPDKNNTYAPPMFRGAGNTWLYKIKKVGS